MLYYSPRNSGFYDPAIHASLPDDAVAITPEKHRNLMAAQSRGQIIVAGKNGHPIAIDPPKQGHEQALAALRARRDELLRQSDFSQLPDAPLTTTQRAAWRTYRQALRDIVASAGNPLLVQWPVPPCIQAGQNQTKEKV